MDPERIKDLAVSASSSTFVLHRRPELPDPDLFWRHSWACAIVGKRLAQEVGFANPDRAYSAGLLHDIGLAAQWCFIPDEFKTAIAVTGSEHVPLHQAEAAMLGSNHAETGQLVAQRGTWTTTSST